MPKSHSYYSLELDFKPSQAGIALKPGLFSSFPGTRILLPMKHLRAGTGPGKNLISIPQISSVKLGQYILAKPEATYSVNVSELLLWFLASVCKTIGLKILSSGLISFVNQLPTTTLPPRAQTKPDEESILFPTHLTSPTTYFHFC